MITNEHIQIAAACAAAWWAGRLRDAVGVGDNGDADVHGAMGCFMTRMIRDRHPPTEENCELFETQLAARIAQLLIAEEPHVRYYDDNHGWDHGGRDLVLSVDYHPCEVLFDALEAAGIDRNVAAAAALPLKTVMRVSARRIIVGHGYGAKFVEIHGPVWGATFEEHAAAESKRERERTLVWDRLNAAGIRGDIWDRWQGPVQL